MNSRIEEILSKMSLEEKVAQLLELPANSMTREQAEDWARRGIGSFLHILGDDAKHLQRVAMNEGNGIPILFAIDAIHGNSLNRRATIFPTQLTMACAWDTELTEKMGRATAKETFSDGIQMAFSPVLCLGRDIRWGRVNETFGEDKYLAGELGSAIIKGYQGNAGDNERVIACTKHYIGYGEATGARDAYDTSCTYRKVRQEFLPPFEKAVTEAKTGSIMTAYGSTDGLPVTADRHLLTDILKDELGFDGFVITDWINLTSLYKRQFVCDNPKEATKLTLLAGNDMIMTSAEFYENAIELVKEGEIDIEVINNAVRRVLGVKLAYGMFDNPYNETEEDYLGKGEHLELNKQITYDTVVMLKNDGILPLDTKKVKKIAVIGENADDIRAAYGDWTYFSHPSFNYEQVPNRPYVTLFEGIKSEAEKHGATVTYAKGVSVLGNDLSGIDEAVRLAKESDVVILAIGDNVFLAGEEKDRANPSLTYTEKALYDALSKCGTPIIANLIASGPLCIPEVKETANAILCGFNGGQFAGEALAKVIFGLHNPAGKLPISFPYHVGQQPSYYAQSRGWHGGKYCDMPADFLFSFGEGMSYTSYEYSNLSFDKSTLTLSVDVKNTGKMDGKEIVQVYMHDPFSSLIIPNKQLIAFSKVPLKAGESKTVTFNLSYKDLSFVNANCERVVEKGEFVLLVGPSSKDSDLLSVSFNVDETLYL